MLAVVVLVVAPSPAVAGGASKWAHTSEADFRPGTFDNVVVTNLGDVKLSRATTVLLDQHPDVGAVNCLVQAPDGAVYAGTSPKGVLLRVTGDKVDVAATIPEAVSVSALAVDTAGRLLVGTSGQVGRVLRIDRPGAEPVELVRPAGAQYVWALASTPDGHVYAATGPNGQVIEVRPDGTSRVLLDTDETNLLSLATDGRDLLYAGSDPNGLVLRVDRRTGESFVLYDAAEAEVAALVVDRAGNLYAGTAEAKPDMDLVLSGGPSVDAAGRPESEPTKVDVPPETPPPPVEPPDPNPGQPEPEPRQVEGGGAGTSTTAPATPTAPGGPAVPPGDVEPDPPRPAGNAIYRIDPAGFVTEVFRENLLVFAVIEAGGQLLAGTGGDGQVYQIDPRAQETIVVAKVAPRQVTALLAARDGRVLAGTANAGGVAALSAGVARAGTYVSKPLDAGQVSMFGAVRVRATVVPQTMVTIATRTGNVAEPAAGWSPWSAEAPVTRPGLAVASPPGRFLQYRLSLTSTDGVTTPVVQDVEVAYQGPNAPPAVRSVRAEPSTDPNARATVTVTWDAADPNGDPLEYAVHVRPVDTAAWVPLKERLTEPTFAWDTRAVADGRYDVRVTASDAPANPVGDGRSAARVSDPVAVDNTAPVLQVVRQEVAPDGRVMLEVRASDLAGPVTAIAFATDGAADRWQSARASDRMLDSPEEAAAVVASGLSPGPHLLVVRATDAAGNHGYLNVPVTVTAVAPERK